MTMTRKDSFHRIMEQYGGDYGKRVLSAYATWQLIHPWISWGQEKYKARVKETPGQKYTITVSGSDGVYADLNEWMLAKMPPVDQRELEVRTIRYEPYVKLSFASDTRALETYLGGHPVTVARSEKNVPKDRPSRDELPGFGGPPMPSMPLIIFTAESPAGRDAVVKFLEETAEKQGRHHSDDEDHPYIFTPAKYAGEWNCRNMLPPRPLTSVYLKNGQLDRLVNDMQAFLDNSDHYKRLSQPWHRGYLFYGPPGTGKTSMARALSDHFNLDMHWLSLADVDKDQDLVQLISNIESRSILLLEDIDAFDTAKDRDGKDGKHASIAALLNALDGVWTPDGLITIMTTNEPDKLDRALVRAGRVGMAEEFGYMDMEQVQAMAGYADWHPDRPEEFVGKSPADFMEAASRALLGLDAQVDEILTQVLGAAA